MSTEKKIPQRQCIGCGEMKNKRDLIRVLKDTEGNIFIDVTGRKNGRGAYLCNNLSCLKKARKSRALDRSLEVEIPEAVYDRLVAEMEHAHG